MTGFKSKLANSAIDHKLNNLKKTGDNKSFIYDKLVFNKVK